MFSIKCLLGLGLLITLSWTQESLSGLNREMERVEREIEREKKLHRAEKKKAAAFEKRKKEKIASLKKQRGEIKNQIGSLKTKLQQLKRQKNRLKGESNFYGGKRKDMSRHIIKHIDTLLVYFQSDFPHQIGKKITDLNNLKGELKNELISPEDGLNRLFTLLSQAVADGYDSEVYSGFYQKSSGGELEGRYIRMGRVASAFVSKDGNTVAYLTMEGNQYKWVEDLNLELKQSIKEAVKVAQGKAAPKLVLLPFTAPNKSGAAASSTTNLESETKSEAAPPKEKTPAKPAVKPKLKKTTKKKSPTKTKVKASTQKPPKKKSTPPKAKPASPVNKEKKPESKPAPTGGAK